MAQYYSQSFDFVEPGSSGSREPRTSAPRTYEQGYREGYGNGYAAGLAEGRQGRSSFPSTERHFSTTSSNYEPPLHVYTNPPPPTDRHCCLHPDCQDEHGSPAKYFSRGADLHRHMRSQHVMPMIDCPKPSCARKGAKGFTRQDHCTEHLRGHHGEDLPRKRGTDGRHAA